MEVVNEVRVTVTKQRQILASCARTIDEANRAFEETKARLVQYDARLADVEAKRASRQRWLVQVAFLKALEVVDEAALARDVLRAERAIERARTAAMVPTTPPKQPKGWWLPSTPALREEAAGWLYIQETGRWRRRWFAAKGHDRLGPMLDWSAAPGTALMGRVVLQGCEVSKVGEEGAMFEFVVTHAMQTPVKLASVNAPTRKQWISVLSQLVRDFAMEQRAKIARLHEASTSTHLINIHLARTRLAVLEARDRADYGDFD